MSDEVYARNSVVLRPRFARAVAWAAKQHGSQYKEGSHVSYVAHVLSVAALVLEDGGSERQAIAALLHDIVEDASVTKKQLRRQFGRKIARIVDGCTEPVEQRSAKNWRRRKLGMLERLRDPATPRSVIRVKTADTLANARSVVADLRRSGPETWQRFNAGAVDQLWYYRSVAVIADRRLPGFLADELRATVREMEQLAGWWFDVGDPQPGNGES